MNNKNKHLKQSNNKAKNKKRAENKTALKGNKSEKFNFDNEIVIGVNLIPSKKKDKSSLKENSNINRKNNKKIKSDNKNVKNKKEIVKKKQKETQQKKHKKVNIKRIIKIILLMAVIIGSIIFIMTTPLFNVTEIDVDGNGRVTKARIESLSKISFNVNTYQYSKREIIKNIMEEPYIESVVVKRKLPSTISIQIKERKRDYIISNLGSYIYIDKQGHVLEITNNPEQIMEIKGMTTKAENLTPGNRLVEEDLDKLNKVIKITDSIKNNNIEGCSSINVTNEDDYCIIMANERKKVHLGNTSNINDRILMLKEILTRENGKEGEVFIQDLNKVYFREASWIE